MSEPKPTCNICAYRENCNKKFSIIDPGKCVEYARDLRIEIKDETPEG